MKQTFLILSLIVASASLLAAASPAPPSAPAALTVADQPVQAPAKYEVKERYGKVNKYTVKLAASDALHLIKVQLGEQPSEKPDYVEFKVNGEKVIRDDRYPYRFIACFVKLNKENTYEVVLKDERPSSFRRPPAVPKNIVVTVLPAPAGTKDIRGSFGLMKWESLKDVVDLLSLIKSREASKLAMDAASLHIDDATRAETMRKLVDLKDPANEDFLLSMFNNHRMPPDVRAEAAIGLGVLGGKKSIPVLISSIIDPDDRISTSCARALSFYPEEQTKDALTEVLQKLDYFRQKAAIRTIVNAGWKPVSTMITLAGSEDPQVWGTAVGILGGMRDPRATDFLLKSLAEPGNRDSRLIIAALGETKDPRAVDALIALAANPAKRTGLEIDLGEALANLGDQRAAEPIAGMAKSAPSPFVQSRLSGSYRKLTGKPL